MDDKTNNHSVADGFVTSGGIPSQAPPRSRLRSSCLAGCGCLLLIMILSVILLGLWVWQINRSPDPFSWAPENEWTLPEAPVALDFVESDNALVALCDDGCFDADSTSIVRCDCQTGAVLSRHQLPFRVSAIAACAEADMLLLAGIVPGSDDDYNSNGLSGGNTPKPPVLRIATMRLSNWALEAEATEECGVSSSWYRLWFRLGESLRVMSLPARHAWVVVLGNPEDYTARALLLDRRTLAEMESRTFSGECDPFSTCLTVDPENSETVLIGRPGSWDSYRWDIWATDSGQVTSVEVQPGNRLPESESRLAIPNDLDLSGRHGQMNWVTPSDFAIGVSLGGAFYASTESIRERGGLLPIFNDNVRYRCALQICSLSTKRLLVRGVFGGRANGITALRFSPGNKYLVTGNIGGHVRVWMLPRPSR